MKKKLLLIGLIAGTLLNAKGSIGVPEAPSTYYKLEDCKVHTSPKLRIKTYKFDVKSIVMSEFNGMYEVVYYFKQDEKTKKLKFEKCTTRRDWLTRDRKSHQKVVLTDGKVISY